MGVMKEFDRRIRAGGDDAIAAVAELWESREKILFDITDAFTKARWIPVSERLPDPGDTVFVYYRILDDDGTPSCVGFDGNGGQIAQDFCERQGDHDDPYGWNSEFVGQKYSHWMPLPEPPEAT